MKDVKKYTIGDMVWVLDDLTFKQIRLANPFEQKLRSSMKPVKVTDAAKKGGELTEQDIENVKEFLLTLESNMYSDDMLKFLCTILRPEMTGWTESIPETYKECMANITEGTLQTVLSDFFSRNVPGKKDRLNGTGS